MNKWRRHSTTIILLLAMGACMPAVNRGPPWSAADESAILAALQASADAWNAGDLPGHLSIYSGDVTFMTDDGPVSGIAPMEEAFTRSYWRDGRPLLRLSFHEARVRPLGDGSALVTARYVLTGGNAPDQTGWFSLIWMRTAEGWKAVHDHSS